MPNQHTPDEYEGILVDGLGNQDDFAQFGLAMTLDDFAEHVLAHAQGFGDLDLLPVGIPDGCPDYGTDCFTPALQHLYHSRARPFLRTTK